jgi:transposase
MRWPGRRVSVYAYVQPTDMRKGFDGLSALVTEGLGRDPLMSGDVFLFVARDRVRAQSVALRWDRLVCLRQALERGRFAAMWRDDRADPIRQLQVPMANRPARIR